MQHCDGFCHASVCIDILFLIFSTTVPCLPFSPHLRTKLVYLRTQACGRDYGCLSIPLLQAVCPLQMVSPLSRPSFLFIPFLAFLCNRHFQGEAGTLQAFPEACSVVRFCLTVCFLDCLREFKPHT